MEAKHQKFTYSDALQCEWSAWRVLEHGQLALDLEDGECCHMPAAIRMAEAIMPGVFRIVTFAGGVPDTEYRLLQGKWSAHLPTRKEK